MAPAAMLLVEMLPTGPMRAEHAALLRRISAIDALVSALGASGSPAERLGTMTEIFEFFQAHLLPHADAEDQVLYPVADAKAAGGQFTASLRHEHRVISRWIDELSVLLRRKPPTADDARMFARRTDALLGLVRGHFECEEEVVLGLLDRTMTPDEFQRDVMSRSA